MRFSFLLALLLAAGASAQQLPPAAVPAFEDAVQLANEGRHDEALTAFRQRAVADPDDRPARLWIARLHERMGHSDLAEPVYRSVLLEDRSNVDAMLGVASTLLERGEAEEALEILEIAEERAEQSAVLFVLLGRAHRLTGSDTLAIGYFERAVALEPTYDSRGRLDMARLSYLHRIETHGFSEQFSGATLDSRNGGVILNYRLSDTWRVLGRGEVQRKVGIVDQRGGGGVEWRWTPVTTLRGQVLVGPNNLVMPEGDYLGEIEYTRGSATWSGSVRHFDFTGARTTVFSPTVAWLASPRLLFGVRYAASRTETPVSSQALTGHSLHVAGDYRLSQRVWLRAGYAAGVENFETFSVDKIGEFRANTVSGGVRIPLPPLTAIVGNYEHQWRQEGDAMGRVTVSLQHLF
ncbi:MAG: YaiO family outer membrane beta-barrel protein [Vicinamibacterales bacterium]